MTDYNPQPGEIFRKGDRTRTVVKVERNDVYYVNNFGREMACWITTWRQWAKDAVQEGEPVAPKLDTIAPIIKVVADGDDWKITLKTPEGNVDVLIPKSLTPRSKPYGLNLVYQGHYC